VLEEDRTGPVQTKKAANHRRGDERSCDRGMGGITL